MSCFGILSRLHQKVRRRKAVESSAREPSRHGQTSEKPPLNGVAKQRTQGPDEKIQSVPITTPNSVVVDDVSATRETDVVEQPDSGDLVTSDPDVARVETQSDVQADELEQDGAATERKVSPVEYYASGYCALCRTQLVHNSLPILEKRSEPWEQWERDCRAVLCLDVETETDHIITHPFHLSDEDLDFDKAAALTHSEYSGVNLRLGIPSVGDRIAYVFHSWCYDVLKWKDKTAASDAVTMYQLAKSLSHEASPWETIGTNATGWLDPPSRIETLIGDLNDEENMKWQPGFLSKLPAEIRAPIWGYVGMRSAYSSFFLVSKETAVLIPSLGESGVKNFTIAKGNTLRWETIRFFGTEYLKTLTNDLDVHAEGSILIEEDPTAINIIVGLPGLCAIQLIGESWESEWIGTVPVPLGGQVWYGRLQNPEMTIEATFTGLTCLDLWHKHPPQLMWDRPDFPLHVAQLDQLREEALFLRWQGQLRTRFEFMRYLPLLRGKEAASGLTFYCSDVGIIGIAAHFSTTTIFSGYRDGLPTYIPFRQGEMIKILLYRLGNSRDDCPAFVLETTKDRIHHIGPYIETENQAPRCRWFPVNAFTYSQVLGLSFQNPRREIACASVHGSPQHRQPVSYKACVKSYPTSNVPTMGYTTQEMEDMQDLDREVSVRNSVPGNGLFLSTAKLENIIMIERCIVGSRTVGLLLHYSDGTKATLGQWYVKDTYSRARNQTIYDNKDPAQCFSFQFSGDERRTMVVDVKAFSDSRFEELEGGAPNEFRCWASTTICWWYSSNYDHLAFSDETTYDIPDEHDIWT